MTVNKYFNSEEGSVEEQDIAESNIIELIQMSGHDVLYIPRSLFAQDKFFQEVPNDKFEDYHTIEMYLNNVTDFGGQGDYMSKFGIEVEDKAEFLVLKMNLATLVQSINFIHLVAYTHSYYSVHYLNIHMNNLKQVMMKLTHSLMLIHINHNQKRMMW